jgi:NitT/TauT family transport system substrate-binding protein
VSLIIVSLVVGLLIAGLGAPAFAADRIRFKTDFSIVEYHAPYFAGIARGVYRQHGLELEVIPGAGSQVAVMDTAAEKVDFAMADMSLVALAALNANVHNVKAIGAYFEITPYTLLYLKNRRITRPQDLNGKTMANFTGNTGGALFKIFARRNGVDVGSIKEIVSAPAAYHNPLIVGQADFAPTTVNRLPTLAGAARQAGNELAEFRFAEYGLDFAGHALLANIKTIEERPDVVKRFVQATLESLQWSARNPEQAVDLLIQANAHLQRALTLAGFTAVLEACIPRSRTATSAVSLGWFDNARVQKTIDAVREAFELTQTVDSERLYTNAYVAKP